MEQIKLFIEKARGDGELMAKLEAAMSEETTLDTLIVIAVEHGFTFTAEEFAKHGVKGVVPEGDLEGVLLTP